jgi:hypothetical protein
VTLFGARVGEVVRQSYVDLAAWLLVILLYSSSSGRVVILSYVFRSRTSIYLSTSN